MEKSQKIGVQIYGYVVCIVAVITFLITMTTLIDAIINLGDPLHAGYNPQGSPSLTSFENYKLDVLKSVQTTAGESSEQLKLDDQTLRGMYEAARNDKIHSVRFQSNKSIIISTVMLIISIVLFVTHWRWMKRY